jgi:hypothetical protein
MTSEQLGLETTQHGNNPDRSHNPDRSGTHPRPLGEIGWQRIVTAKNLRGHREATMRGTITLGESAAAITGQL